MVQQQHLRSLGLFVGPDTVTASPVDSVEAVPSLHEPQIEDPLAFLAGGGEMGAMMRAKDWSATSLGAAADWPQVLRTSVRLLLNARHPIFAFWGPSLACFYNDAYRVLIGPERHPSALGQPACEVWAEIWDTIGPLVERVISAGQSFWRENQLIPITRNGRLEDVYWTYSYSPIGQDGSATGVGGVLIICAETTAQVLAEISLRKINEALEQRITAEIAARSKTEAALRQAQKMEAIGQLTGGIAHDFSNLLQAVASGIELAKRRIDAGQPARALALLDAARDAADRAVMLTRRLLDFGRLQPLDPRSVDLNSLVQGMAGLITQTAGSSVHVQLKLCDACWLICCDTNQLENALLNLAINARDAMLPAGGQLRIETSRAVLNVPDLAGWETAVPGDFVRLTVGDSGSGIEPDVLARVFEPFFTTKPEGRGTGLGLSQIHGFMRQSAGVVQLESVVGVGTSVHLYFPRLQDAAAFPGSPGTKACHLPEAPLIQPRSSSLPRSELEPSDTATLL